MGIKKSAGVGRGAGPYHLYSLYAWGIAHAFGKIWKERALLNFRGKAITHEQVIELEALSKPHKIAIVHILAHQKGNAKEAVGN